MSEASNPYAALQSVRGEPRLPTPVHREPWQDRIVNERNDLEFKMHGLTAFIDSEVFDTLPAAEQGRLQRQKLIMIEYLAVLNERVVAW